MPLWTFWKTQRQKNLSWNGTKKSLKKEKLDWKKENFTLIRDIRKDSKWTFLNNKFKEKGGDYARKSQTVFQEKVSSN